MVTETKTQARFNTQLVDVKAPREGEAQDDGKPVKVTFDEAQQKRVDELIREAQGRSARDVRQELETTKATLTSLQQELEAAKALSKSGTASERKEAKDDASALQAQIDEIKRAGESTKAELERARQAMIAKDKELNSVRESELNTRKRVAIQGSASKLGFVDLDDVMALTERNIQWDSDKGKWIVMGDGGVPRVNSAYEPMGLDEYYADVASKKPWLVRSDTKGGTGSTEASRSSLNNGRYAVEQIFGQKSDPSLANKLAKDNPAEYRRLKQVAREAKLISW